MENLSKLKNVADTFMKISITNDYTSEEREMIRNKLAEARNMTKREGNGVGGTSKNRVNPETVQEDPGRCPINNNINIVSKLGLKCLYTNADQFINKRDELITLISPDLPDVMLIMEVILQKQVNPVTMALLKMMVTTVCQILIQMIVT